MNQLTFDDACRSRDDALESVESNADAELLAKWWGLFREFCGENREVFCDAFLRWALEVEQARPLREPRAIGALFQRAAREKLIAKTGEYRPSVRSHLAAKPVWRSLVYRGGE